MNFNLFCDDIQSVILSYLYVLPFKYQNRFPCVCQNWNITFEELDGKMTPNDYFEQRVNCGVLNENNFEKRLRIYEKLLPFGYKLTPYLHSPLALVWLRYARKLNVKFCKKFVEV
jgi:hypothetical protein